MIKFWARVWCLVFLLSHSVIATQPEKDRATALRNKRKILVKIGHVVPEDMLADRQTEKYTNRYAHHSTSPHNDISIYLVS